MEHEVQDLNAVIDGTSFSLRVRQHAGNVPQEATMATSCGILSHPSLLQTSGAVIPSAVWEQRVLNLLYLDVLTFTSV